VQIDSLNAAAAPEQVLSNLHNWIKTLLGQKHLTTHFNFHPANKVIACFYMFYVPFSII
jgi:hypothetical protein